MTMIKKIIKEETAPGLSNIWELNEVLFDSKTDYQEVVIGRGSHGITLFCGNERQSSELSQQIYHEGQWFPAVLLSESLSRVLIIGSSEGVITQMAKASGADNVVHVDIDEECVRVCAKYLPYGYTEKDIESHLQNREGVKLLFQDGFKFVDECLLNNEVFDVVVMDLPDEHVGNINAQQNRLYEKSFLEKISKILSPKGVFITQAGCPTYWRNQSLRHAWERMNLVFSGVAYFEMEEQNWSWIVGGNFITTDVATQMIKKLDRLSFKPKFIDETAITRATLLPISIRKNL